MKMRRYSLNFLALAMLCAANVFAASINIKDLAIGEEISFKREIAIAKVCGYTDDNKQIRNTNQEMIIYSIARTEEGYSYSLTLPEASCVSYSPQCREDFVECLTRAFQDEKTMKYYAQRKTFSPLDAKNKAIANADLHQQNLTKQDPRPRFIVRVGDETIGFVRVGGADNPWDIEALAPDFKRLGFKKDRLGQWIDNIGDAVHERGIGEIGILLQENQTNKGLGRMVLTAMIKVVMPLCRKIGMLYDDKVVGYVVSTVSADNARSRSILSEHLTQINSVEVESQYSAEKLYYYHKIDDSFIDDEDIILTPHNLVD